MSLARLTLANARFVASKSSGLSSTTRICCMSRRLRGIIPCLMSLLLQREIESGSQARLRFEPDLAVVPFDDFPHKGQADAGSLFRILLVLQPFEDPENLFVKFHRDAAPIVFHVEDISGV